MLNLMFFILLASKDDLVQSKISCPDNFICECRDVSTGGNVEQVIDCSDRGLTSLPYFGVLTGKTFDKILLNDNKITRIASGSFRGLSVKKMDISNNHIKSFSDNAFEDIPDLEELTMVNCGLTSTSRSFQVLAKMKRLDLHNNKINQIHPKSFVAMTELEYLDLHNNPIELGSPFTAFANMHKVKFLYLQHCGLHNIPKAAIGHMTKLVKLNLGHNHIHALPNGLLDVFNHLVFLDLSENPLIINPHENLFKGIKLIKTLKFSGCFTRGYKLDKRLFKHTIHIRKLVFAACNLTTIAPGTFSGLNHLHYLDISGNKVPVKPDVFQGVTDTVHTLKISKMDLTSFPKDLIKSFANLKRIYVENNKITKLPQGIFQHFPHEDSHIHFEGNTLMTISNRILQGSKRPISLYFQNTGLRSLDFLTENPCSFWESTLDVTDNRIRCDCDVFSAMQMKVARVNGACAAPELYDKLKLDWRPGQEPQDKYLSVDGNITELCNKEDRSGYKYDCGCKLWVEVDAPEMCPVYDSSHMPTVSNIVFFICLLMKMIVYF